MPDLSPQLEGVARVIQLAIAPVFLLTGIGAFLAVLAGRLARVIDRARGLETSLLSSTGEMSASITAQLATLSRRASLAYRAISMCVMAALFVCIVIIALFTGALAHVNVGVFVAVLFLGAMLALVAALVLFLREVFLATRTLRIGHYIGGRLSKAPAAI